MSHILCQWLNTELTLTTKVEPVVLDESFRSGYLFAEILHQYHLIESLAAYQKTYSTDGAIKNFTLLEPTLRAIGVPLTSTSAYEVISGKQGSAAHLLYQIKSSLLNVAAMNLEGAIQKYKQHPVNKEIRTTKNKETLPKYILETTNKKTFVQKEHGFFTDRLKAKFRRLPPVQASGKCLPVVTERQPSSAKSPEHTTAKPKAVLKTPVASVDDVHAPKKAVVAKSKEELVERSRVASQKQEDIRRLKEQTKAAAIEQKKLTMVKELVKEVEVFDAQHARMDKLGKSAHSNPNQMTPTEVKDLRRQIQEATVDAQAHESQLQERLPSADFYHRQTEDYLEKIRNKRMEDEVSRKEREHRRRKILLGQQKAQQEFERAQREAILLEKLAKQSKQERRIAEQLLEMKSEKDIMRQNRIFRDQQYAERRQKDFEEAMTREAVLAEQMRVDYLRQAAMQMQQHQEIIAERERRQHEKHLSTCRHVAEQIVDIATNMIHYVEVNDKLVPEKLAHQWKLLFLNDRPILPNYHVPLEKEKIDITAVETIPAEPVPSSAEAQEGTALSPIDSQQPDGVDEVTKELDQQEFSDYLSGNGAWPYLPSEETNSATNEYLTKLVDGLFTVVAGPVRKVYVSKLSTSPLKLILLGKRFSGKHCLAQRLAEYCKLKVLTPHGIMTDAIKAAETNETVQDDKDKPVPSVRAQLGAKAQEMMLQGKPVDDNLLVSMIANAIRSLNAAIAVDSSSMGWVLVDFPRTKAQAQALEKELSGYEEPKPQKLGNLKRIKSAGKEKEIPKNNSMIAPPNGGGLDQGGAPESVIDAIFLLDVENEVAIRRASGRRVDPVTGKVYHVEFDPPAENEPGLLERLAPVEDEVYSDNQLQFQLVAFEEQQGGVKEWFSKFNNIHTIDSNPAIENVLNNVETILQPIVEKKAGTKPSTANSLGERQSSPPQSQAAAAPTALEGADQSGTTPAATGDRPLTASYVASSKPSTAKAVDMPPNELLQRTVAKVGPRGVTRELASILTNRWITLESSYTDGLKFIFRSLRREREAAVRFFFENKMSFREFLLRPDKKQALVDQFQKEYNVIEDDLRSDPEAKAELHQRIEDLRERLWAVSDERKDEAELERLNMIENRWVEDHMMVIANLYLNAIQMEIDRYIGTKQVILDYTKDINEIMVDESTLTAPRIPLVDLANPPEGLFQDVLRIKHDLPAALIPANILRKNQQAAGSGKKGASAHKKAEKQNTDKQETTTELVAVVHAEHPFESDALYAHINNAATMAINFIADIEFTEPIVNEKAAKNDKKKATTEIPQEAKEINQENLQEAKESSKQENIVQRRRIERLKAQAVQHLKELKSKAFEVFMQLDEWIGIKFQTEMESIRDLVTFIKEAVEQEQKLPHELILEGEHFFINFDVLAFEPEPESRPQSPIESKKPDQFTVHQLLNLSVQFRALAPKGTMTLKEFKEALQRFATFTPAQDWLPEHIVLKVSENNLLQQMLKPFDPHLTGTIDWRHYLLKQARVLPVELETLQSLKKQFNEYAKSNERGLISFEQYFSTNFWFEKTSVSGGFDRGFKLKQVLFQVFSTGSSEDQQSLPHWMDDHEWLESGEDRLFDWKAFLRGLAFDEEAVTGLEKAFYVYSSTFDGYLNEQEVLKVFGANDAEVAETHRFDGDWARNELFPKTSIKQAFKAYTEGDRMDFNTFISMVEPRNVFLNCQLYKY